MERAQLAGQVVERLNPLRLKSEGGQTLYDIPDAPRPDPDTPAPVRLVAPFDDILLSHADRTRAISDAHRKRLFSGKNGVFPGTVLVDGFVAGTWELVVRRSAQHAGSAVCRAARRRTRHSRIGGKSLAGVRL